MDLEAAQIMPSGIDGSEHGTVAESGQFTDSHVEENSSNPTIRADRLHRSAALFLLSIKECYQIPQTALEFAVSQVQQMLTYTVEDMKQFVKECLLPHLQASGVQIELLETLCVPDPFSSLQSEYMQTKYYKENFDLVVSKCQTHFLTSVTISLYCRNLRRLNLDHK